MADKKVAAIMRMWRSLTPQERDTLFEVFQAERETPAPAKRSAKPKAGTRSQADVVKDLRANAD